MAGTLGWFGLTLSFVLFSCVPIQLQLHEDDLKLIVSDPIIYVVTFKPPPFEVDTSTNVALIGGVLGGAGGAVGGAVGAAVAGAVTNAAAGANPTAIQRDPRALLRFTTYEDPVKQVRDDFVKTVQDELKLSRVIVVEEALEDESPKALSDKFHNGIVLGFKTEEWVLAVVPLSSDFWIKYRASGMFYVPQENRYLWREICGFVPRDAAASLAELAENSGQGLKYLLKDTGSRCAKQLAAEIIERTSRISRPR